ncbi:hypothetical protein BJ508DRAFT_309207 [Ascobolus immersus RN42]|uniref:BTB domain-containing protein n=1 Tax=Ascobolus immersus RN42 TaxID=1160509 RepID=A0A3N4HX75_ASCIM|nr:hypothetical protein BJ508DRAFT_309207 [Ascobolus immersus RN42]
MPNPKCEHCGTSSFGFTLCPTCKHRHTAASWEAIKEDNERLQQENNKLLALYSGVRDFHETTKAKTIEVTLKPSGTSTNEVSYHLHINKLRHSSEYFAGLLNFNGTEITANKIDLSELANDGLADAFDYFVDFLYFGDYELSDKHKELRCVMHGMVYVLADRILSKPLKSLALTELRKILDTSATEIDDGPFLKLVELTYTRTYSNQPRIELPRNGDAINNDRSSKRRRIESITPAPSSVPDFLRIDERMDTAGPPLESEPLRLLVCGYAAFKLSRLKHKNTAFFRMLLDQFPEFSRDLVLQGQA